MPKAVRWLTETNLHDADLLACEETPDPEMYYLASHRVLERDEQSHSLALWVRHMGVTSTIFYHLWDRMREQAALEAWPFSPLKTHWLYDEFDKGEAPHQYWHRILLSDGRVLSIPFWAAYFHRVPRRRRRATPVVRQST